MFEHISVLKNEAVDALNIKPNGIYVDCTLGGGGHSEAILKKLDGGHLIAFDQDPDAREEAITRLASFKDKFTVVAANFRHLKEELQKLDITQVDGILYDLGVSSPQFDKAERGFSYRFNGPLDMRMNPNESLSAHEIINEWPFGDLVRIFYKYGEEKFSKSIARKIESARELKTIETTDELVEIIKDAIPAPARRKGGHPAKRTFQALRIAVNDELKVFEESLEQAVEMTGLGGRIAVITFHSLEDRICKQLFNKYSKGPDVPPGMPALPTEYEPILKLVQRKPILPTEDEMNENHRAHSAKLRIAEKIKNTKEAQG